MSPAAAELALRDDRDDRGVLPSLNRGERRALARSRDQAARRAREIARRERRVTVGPARARGRPRAEMDDPSGRLTTPVARVVRCDDATARLLLEPVSGRLAAIGRYILSELAAPYLERGVPSTDPDPIGRTGRVGRNVRTVLASFLYKSEAYRDLRGDLLAWDLPGHGLDPDPTDGEWYSVAHDVGGRRHVTHGRHSCERSRCEYSLYNSDGYELRQKTGRSWAVHDSEIVCWRKWHSRETNEATDRISWASLPSPPEGHGTMRSGERVIHVIVSPRPVYTDGKTPEWVRHRTLAGYRDLRTDVTDFARLLRLKGWLLIHHPKRVSRGRWSAAHGCVDGDHFHMVAHGWVRKTPLGGWGELDPRFEGWFVKNKGPRSSVHGTIGYLLSHAGLSVRALPPGPVSLPRSESPGESFSARSPTLAVTWGGDWSTRSFKVPEPTEEAVPVRFCAVCKRLIPEFEWFRCIHVGAGPPARTPVDSTPDEWRAVMLDPHDRKADWEYEENFFYTHPSRHGEKQRTVERVRRLRVLYGTETPRYA